LAAFPSYFCFAQITDIARRRDLVRLANKTLPHRRSWPHDYRELISHSAKVHGGTCIALAGTKTTTESKVKLALVGLVALGGAALSAGTASAMPIGLATNADIASNVEQVRIVCDVYGRCFRTGGYYYGGPVVRYGYGGGWHRGWRGRRW
jgi:hypothetical protein